MSPWPAASASPMGQVANPQQQAALLAFTAFMEAINRAQGASDEPEEPEQASYVMLTTAFAMLVVSFAWTVRDMYQKLRPLPVEKRSAGTQTDVAVSSAGTQTDVAVASVGVQCEPVVTAPPVAPAPPVATEVKSAGQKTKIPEELFISKTGDRFHTLEKCRTFKTQSKRVLPCQVCAGD